MLNVRKAEEADIPKCIALAKIEELESPGEVFLDFKYFSEFLGSDLFLVAEKDGILLGFLIGEKEGNETVFLNVLAVEKAQRGRGIGSALLARFKEIITKKGFKKVALFAPDWNKQTLDFYKKHGFATTERKYRYFTANL